MNPARPALSVADWTLLNRMLEQALALDETARSDWLRDPSPETAHLLPLVAELLAESAAQDAAGDARVAAAVASVANDALAAMRVDRPGDRIGPWQLERLLAEGGMGTVWVAQRDDGIMRRTVALKLPRAEWVDPGLRERLARERAILARLQHPHIAVLYDAGVGADGRPYLALEYVDGVRIDAYCRTRDARDVVRLVVQVARAVAYAHSQLVIHRDLKPANLLVTADGTPKLLDFGISKLIEGDPRASGDAALTELAGRRLTLAYAAPEQIRGQPVSVAADVYALGVVLYELLAGQRPFSGDDPRALETAILRGDPRRPSEAARGRARARALSGDLDAIVLTALKPDPAQRYRSADALADDLDAYLAGRPVKARPDGIAYRLRKFVARNALPVAAGAAVVFALSVGLAVALWQAERASALNTFLLSLIQEADPAVSQQTRAADLALLASIERKIDEEFKGSPEQLLQLRLTVGTAYLNRGEMAAARRVFQRAVDEAAPHLPADDLMLLTARVKASDHHLIVSMAASEQLDAAIATLRGKAAGSAAAAELLIDALLIRHELQSAYGVPAYLPAERRLDDFREANALAVRKFGQGSRQQLAATVPARFWVANVEGIDAARRMFESALAHARERDDRTTDSVEYLLAEAALAALGCADARRQAESLQALHGAIERARVAHDSTSVVLERLHALLGNCRREARRPSPATAESAAFEIAAARERPPSINLMTRASDAFDAAIAVRDYAAAERFNRIALQNAEAIPEPPLRERLTLRARYGRVCLLAGQGRAEAAEEAAAPLIAHSDAVYAKVGRLTPRQGELWLCLANAQRQQGHYERALRTLQTYIDRTRTTGLSPNVMRDLGEGAALIERALVELDAGQPAAAQASLEARRAMSSDMDGYPSYALAYGRTLVATGRAGEAIEPLRRFHEQVAALKPDSPYAAEALYWLGQAHAAAGDPRGRDLVAKAGATLAASPVASHRRLAERAAPG